jgi:uncharacterized protein (TIGR02646 family)
MIKVHRQPKPKILVRKEDEWRKALLSAVSAGSRQQRSRAETKYRHREIKDALVRMFYGKCAYCESKITHIDYGHIEHFRPKRGASGRPDLTFEWDNMLLACGLCNGAEHKSDHFPEANEGGPLINPCDDAPEAHLEFRFDPVARLASVYGKTSRGATTEQLLGLNRTDLREYRSRRICKLLVLAQYAGSDPEAARLIEEAKRSSGEYAAFARTLLR